MKGSELMISELIQSILDREGWPVFTNDPDDHGGPTKGGITLRTLTEWRETLLGLQWGGVPAVVDLVDLTHGEATAIYRYLYTELPKFDQIIDNKLRDHVIDAGVHHGVYWATKCLQEISGVVVDGYIGPKTLGAVNKHMHHLRIPFAVKRIRKMSRIVANDQSQLKYLVGWIKRATSFLLDDDPAITI